MSSKKERLVSVKKISFALDNKEVESFVVYPEPAIKNLPEWYKAMQPYEGGKFSLHNFNASSTVKKCIPFLDAISAGYYIFLNCDIYVDEGPYFNWLVNVPTWQPVSASHDDFQMKEFDFGNQYSPHIFKWMNPFFIKTPKGYSTHIFSPANIVNSPFYTLSGVVDTDKFNVPIHFPFLINKDFTGIIKRGTPIAQVVPFKRDDWKMSYHEEKTPVKERSLLNFSTITNQYKKNFWSRKRYN